MQVFVYHLRDKKQWKLSIDWRVDHYYWKLKGQSIEQWILFSSIGKAKAWIEKERKRKELAVWMPQSPPFDLALWKKLEEDADLLLYQLEGRALLWNEMITLIHQRGYRFSSEWLLSLLQRLYLDKQCEIYPGIDVSGPRAKWRCLRCHATTEYIRNVNCASCGENCTYCENCIHLGRSRSCMLLIRVPKIKNNYKFRYEKEIIFHNQEKQLTVVQQKASEEIDLFLDSDKSQILVWAVTGAGKTEIMIPSVRRLLTEKKHVCWVTPRTEVVHELKPRLEKALSPFLVLSLYGGSAQLWDKGTMVLTTAHQLWRYYRWFDVVIIDEVDAFPLYKNSSLEQGILSSLLPQAKMIFLTATPPEEWLQDIRKERLDAVIVPTRYHRQPLPEPKCFRTWWLWRKLRKGQALPIFSQFLEQVEKSDGQAFLFVPRIQDIATVLNWLKKREPQWFYVSAGVYSHDPNRKHIIDEFKKGKLRFLITTTIMERGITIPRCHVLVIGADHPVFQRSTLIQIAGRVGRKADWQKGQVWFWAEANTIAQQKAAEEIRWLNQYAQKMGFLHKGDG